MSINPPRQAKTNCDRDQEEKGSTQTAATRESAKQFDLSIRSILEEDQSLALILTGSIRKQLPTWQPSQSLSLFI